MRSRTAVVLGTIVGLIVGTLSLLVAYYGITSGGASTLPLPLVVSAIAGSMVAGTAGVMVGCLLTSRERMMVTPLMSVAIASIIVLPGNYSNGSLLPPVIYGMALINGLIIARVIGPLCSTNGRSGKSRLS
jgi:hypothetical protein